MNILRNHIFLLLACILFSPFLFAQYPPPAGQPGTTAIYKDSSAIIGWASNCNLERGFVNISDTAFMFNGSNKATYGSYLYVNGPADDYVASLGDHGSALLGFDIPIVNRSGPDFAVFENSFGDAFLELAFIEVSSDGERFVRFPAISLTPGILQVNTFDTLDATKIHNFAGKYRHAYGTPFDLDDIKDSTGIDLNNIISIRVIDVVGCIQSPFATTDAQGHTVNDPWPTPFDTGGFDLDAIGVIHNKTEGVDDLRNLSAIRSYPNPVIDKVTVNANALKNVRLDITDVSGNILMSCVFNGKIVLDLSAFHPGIYFTCFTLQDGNSVTQKIVKY